MEPRKELKSGDLRMEYLVKDGNLIVHFFWERPHPTQAGMTRSLGDGFPEQPVFAPWPQLFRELAWKRLVSHFRMDGKENQVEVHWVPELFSYDATVKGIANLAGPSDASMATFIKELTPLLDK